MMFLLNEGYGWKATAFGRALGGAVYPASTNHRVRIERKPRASCSTVLFDPQLYLAGLDASACPTVCARLASFPWFCLDHAPQFDSSATNQTKWQQSMKDFVAAEWTGELPSGDNIERAAFAAVELQTESGFSHVLLPTPLLSDREHEASDLASWLDAGISAAGELDIGEPVLATVAVDESALGDLAFNPNGFIDAAIEQVVSRDGINGVYIVVAQSDARHPFKSPETVVRAYMRLVHGFASAGVEEVITNYADVCGVACLGLGATGFATGPSQSLRRLSLPSFAEEAAAMNALPHYYSHRCAADFRPQRDLRIIAAKRRLQMVKDTTTFSQQLLDALTNKGHADSVGPWAETRSNLSQAAKHLLSRMIKEGDRYESLTPEAREERVAEWLDAAATRQDTLRRVLQGEDAKPNYAPVDMWARVFQETIDG